MFPLSSCKSSGGRVGFNLSLSLLSWSTRSPRYLSFDASLIVLALFVRQLEPAQLFTLFGHRELWPGFDPSTFQSEGQHGASEPRRQIRSRDLFLYMDSANRMASYDVESRRPSLSIVSSRDIYLYLDGSLGASGVFGLPRWPPPVASSGQRVVVLSFLLSS